MVESLYEDEGGAEQLRFTARAIHSSFTLDASAQAIINASLDAIVLMDPDNRICGCNRAAGALLGYTDGELFGNDISVLMPEPYASRHVDYVRSYRLTGKAHVMGVGRELCARRKDGSVLPIYLSLNSFFNHGRQYFAGFIRDLSAQKSAEVELLAARDELESRVQERTRELEMVCASLQEAYQERVQAEAHNLRLQEGLRSAQRMEAVGRLSAGMAHDFNNLLAAVLGHAELLLMQHSEGSIEDGLQHIIDAVLRGRDLVVQMLNFARGNRLPEGISSCVDVVQALARLLKVNMPAGIQFDVCIADLSVPKVRINPVVLEQLLMNLCLNARDAMGETGLLTLSVLPATAGERCLCSACHAETDAEGFVRFDVTDNGSGIRPELLPHIFAPFFSTKLDLGTGLGLSMVDTLVHESGGHVSVENLHDGGARFSLWLPACGLTEQRQASPEVLQRVRREKRAMRVLVVDDEITLAHLLREALSHAGYEVQAVCHAETALRRLAENPRYFDLLISDQVMPGMNGVELICQARRLAPELRTLMCTGDMGEMDVTAMKCIDAFLQKPMSLSDTLQAVRHLLPQGCDV